MTEQDSSAFYTQEELAAEVRRLRYLYPDGQQWHHRLWLAWLRITDEETYHLTADAWEQIKKEDTEQEEPWLP